eukprot:jgi/Tetstr1/448814/TSEL_036048.t1
MELRNQLTLGSALFTTKADAVKAQREAAFRTSTYSYARPADSNSVESHIYQPGESSSGGESSQPASGVAVAAPAGGEDNEEVIDLNNVGEDDDMEDRELNRADSAVA